MGNENRPLALVVDDEEAIREFLAEFLGGTGFGVDCASSGEEAVEKIRSETYDLVLTDIRLPGLDGMKVLEAARSCSPEIAVIVITGFGTVSGAVEAMKLGADDYLSKPFSAEAVDVVVHKALELQRLRGSHSAPEQLPRPPQAGTSLGDIERETILRTLEFCGGNRTLAAKTLGITPRTLRNKLHRWGTMDAFKRKPVRPR